ncbi:MAG TPA: hypothetical protein VLL54_09955 [Pyrinomonadaceae bacterium]|nr:hypothetical protein [Pyrinomonadaceae bacterium]
MEQWITVLGILASFVVWFLGHKWVGRKSARKICHDFTVVAIPIGLLILSLVVFEYDRTNSVERQVDSLSVQTRELENLLQESGHLEKITGYDEFVAVIEKEVKLAKSRWLITRVQTNQSQTQRERAYFETMVSRVISGEITDCRRIVRIPTAEHLSLYRELISRMGTTPSFAIAVWTADEPPFDYELLVGDDVVILAFGKGAPTQTSNNDV